MLIGKILGEIRICRECIDFLDVMNYLLSLGFNGCLVVWIVFLLVGLNMKYGVILGVLV